MTSNQRIKLFFISELATIFKILSTVILITIVLERVVGMELHESYPFQGGYALIAWFLTSVLELSLRIFKLKLKKKYRP
ncbi:hypothetical protein [uncultured Pseudoalteromonas sp.]|uniref:hypothetical protein n=1 Tax=uncultured Pseudoalteromonas sp. TaxID=114053 RepID=UPI000C533238|nr:hypothetical protein [uncultured Pseudoalteromonas sp.]MBD57568.1 hypothetical protein [Pseudoalteromonas sp.]